MKEEEEEKEKEEEEDKEEEEVEEDKQEEEDKERLFSLAQVVLSSNIYPIGHVHTASPSLFIEQ